MNDEPSSVDGPRVAAHASKNLAAAPTAYPIREARVAVATQSLLQTSTAWPVVFEDDFTVANLADPASSWQTGYGWGQTMAGELEYYTRYDKNFSTSCNKGGVNHEYTANGTLKLWAKYEPGNYEVWHWDNAGNLYTTCEPYNYTSAMLWSKQQFLYGQFELRCKLPFQGRKLWPAFWLWQGNPYREIDIFEFDDPNATVLLTNAHIDKSLDFAGPTGSNDDYPGATALVDVSQFHTYAVQWRPNSVTYLFDGVPVRVLAGHSPPLPMNLIVNLAIAPWRTPPSPSDLPAAMELDYVRVSHITDPEFLYTWANGGSQKIAAWNMAPDDRYFAGNFAGDGHALLLAMSSTGWAQFSRWDGANWNYVWGNNGSHAIASWQMKTSDVFVIGDFNGDGRDELLCLAQNGWAQMLGWTGSSWVYLWGNNGDGAIATWQIHAATDRYAAGDFDGDGRVELIAAGGGWSHVLHWAGSGWQYQWGNGGNGLIGLWHINNTDRFLAFDADGDGKAELMAIGGGWSQVMKFQSGAWNYAWGNNGAGSIALWQMHATDRYYVGDFEGTGHRMLLAISAQGWAQCMSWDGASWQYRWGNDGGHTIHRWYMNQSDNYVPAAFGGAKCLLLATAANGWAQLMRFEPVP